MKQEIIDVFVKYPKVLPISIGFGLTFALSLVIGSVVPSQEAEAAIFVVRSKGSIASGSP